jgi:hypothetical protein
MNRIKPQTSYPQLEVAGNSRAAGANAREPHCERRRTFQPFTTRCSPYWHAKDGKGLLTWNAKSNAGNHYSNALPENLRQFPPKKGVTPCLELLNIRAVLKSRRL